MQPADIEHRFAFHAATTQEKRDEHTSVRQHCRRLADELNERLPEGREKSLAITKLEEVMFWANAAIARAGSATS
ncbi:hypothetical protein AB0P07_11710 [Streptomyces sp. NPDC085944]|uniref:Acb2/Tad1 domain-containing protein n=1 Tax=Streptomyces sp. NPDC085944 TaxID=3154962 RepID=UPI003412B079